MPSRCPRCGGDMFIDWDIYGYFRHCIQCGYVEDIVQKRKPDIRDEIELELR